MNEFDRDALTAQLETLQYEIDAIQAIKAERDQALEQNSMLDAKCAELAAAAKLALDALEKNHYAIISAGLLDQVVIDTNFTAHAALKAVLK